MRTQVGTGAVRGQLEGERREPGAECEVEMTGCDKAKNTAAVLASLSAGSPWWHREACPQRLRPITSSPGAPTDKTRPEVVWRVGSRPGPWICLVGAARR